MALPGAKSACSAELELIKFTSILRVEEEPKEYIFIQFYASLPDLVANLAES